MRSRTTISILAGGGRCCCRSSLPAIHSAPATPTARISRRSSGAAIWPVAADCAACHTVPDQRPAVRRRAPHRDAVRQHHLGEHHARPRDRHRRLERRGVRQRRAQGHAAERRAALSRDALYRLHQDVAVTTCWRSAPISRPLQPVRNPVVTNTLPFPFNIRAAMRVWDWLYFTAGRIQARSANSRRNGTAARSWCRARAIAPPAIRRNRFSAATREANICAARNFKAGSRPTSPMMTAPGLGRWSPRTSPPI